MKAWHFTRSTLRDGSPVPHVGDTLVFAGLLRLCESGLHASLKPFDALQYAPGEHLHLVECSGQIIKSNDKLVCSERTILASMDEIGRASCRERVSSPV